MPLTSQFAFDVFPDQPAYHLRGRSVISGTQAFKHRLLSGVDQDGQTGGSIFNGHRFGINFHW